MRRATSQQLAIVSSLVVLLLGVVEVKWQLSNGFQKTAWLGEKTRVLYTVLQGDHHRIELAVTVWGESG